MNMLAAPFSKKDSRALLTGKGREGVSNSLRVLDGKKAEGNREWSCKEVAGREVGTVFIPTA